MLKLYKNISYLFLGILLLIFLGFYKTYFSLFPSFHGLPTMAHFHAAAFLTWFALLIVQPILIRKKKLATHRLLGRLSYFLIPLIIFTTIGMTRYEYYKDIETQTRKETLSGLLQSYLDLSFFVAFYVVAIINRKRLSLHLSFMIAASLVLVSPGLGRLSAHLFRSYWPAVIITSGAVYLTLIVLMIMERKKLHRSILRSPYLLILILFIIKQILLHTAGETPAWQWVADKIATHLF
jgi:hypothetical protein